MIYFEFEDVYERHKFYYISFPRLEDNARLTYECNWGIFKMNFGGRNKTRLKS